MAQEEIFDLESKPKIWEQKMEGNIDGYLMNYGVEVTVEVEVSTTRGVKI